MQKFLLLTYQVNYAILVVGYVYLMLTPPPFECVLSIIGGTKVACRYEFFVHFIE